MSYIEIDDYGYAERDAEMNWAAEYAKRVTNELEEKHDEDMAAVEAAIAEARAAAEGALFRFTAAPKKIGEWMDGKPIYRKAFSVDYADVDDDYIKYGDMNFSPSSPIIGLGGCCILKTGASTSLGDIVPEYDKRNINTDRVFDISKLSADVLSELSGGGTFYGYIDYIG